MIRSRTCQLALLFALSSTVIAAAQAPAPAEAGQGPNVTTEKGTVTPSAAGAARLAQAADLVSYARQTESPAAMLVAVQMIRSVRVGEDRVGTKESAPTPATTGRATAAGPATKTTKPASSDPVQLLDEARAWATGDAHMVALLDSELARAKTGQSGSLGATGASGASAPVDHRDRVEARTKDTYTIRFRGLELAEIGVRGDGDTDLDLFVYDENGNLVVSDTDATDRCYVSWTPRWTGNYRVEIHNLGRVYNNYKMLTN